MLEKKKPIVLIGTLECPLAIGCVAFIKEEGYDPFRTSTVRRFVKMPFGVTYIKTENSRYILRSPVKAAVKEVRA